MSVKDNVKNVNIWLKGIFILVFSVILYVVGILVYLLAAFQFITKLITGELNHHVKNFAAVLTDYIMQVLAYITFQSEDRPFPFKPFEPQKTVHDLPPAESADMNEPDEKTKIRNNIPSKTRRKKTADKSK